MLEVVLIGLPVVEQAPCCLTEDARCEEANTHTSKSVFLRQQTGEKIFRSEAEPR
jgi:hypothetical protein